MAQITIVLVFVAGEGFTILRGGDGLFVSQLVHQLASQSTPPERLDIIQGAFARV